MSKKLILFDIDGTLILTGGVAARLMAEAVAEQVGMPVQWNIRDFVGNTDRNIIYTLLNRSGVREAIIEETTNRSIENYLKKLEQELKKDEVVTILPGVRQLLAVLKNDSRCALGLLTGNVLAGAQIKLAKEDLFSYFPIGAFGDDALKREQLPSFAIQRAEKYYGHFFNKKDIWIVGDSVNDIKCAQANHLKSLAVASGHVKEEELAEYHPSALLPDLVPTEKIVNILLS
jgi:phosphoglycolate phosphatase-like HAD superfamily hydrolase